MLLAGPPDRRRAGEFVLFAAFAAATAVMVGGCKREGASSEKAQEMQLGTSPGVVVSAETDEPSRPATSRPPEKPLGPDQRIDIAAGEFVSGSMPGDRGRDPGLEPAMVKVKLGAFSIDRLPYPNDPSKPPMTGITRTQAEQLCKQRQQRLCSELEWERACKGPQGDVYPTGAGWDARCEQSPHACATGFDVVAMSATLREWTSNNLETQPPQERVVASVRGARSNVADTEHRCARRQGAEPSAQADDIGFRCCSGPPNTASIEAPKLLQTFRRVKLDESQVTSLIRSVPQLAHLGDVSFFKEPDDVDRVLAKGDAGKQGNTLTTSPLMWSPAPGEELLVLAAKGSNGSSFVAALYRLPEDRYRLASSFVLQDEPGPIVLGFNGWAKNRLAWSGCWGCQGEEGGVFYREGSRVVIEQR